jgi:carbonic anhydrase
MLGKSVQRPVGRRRSGALSALMCVAAAVTLDITVAARHREPAAPAPQAAAAHEAAHEKHWAYEDGLAEIGPAHWGELAGNAPCSTGQRQSPIALTTAGGTAAAPAAEPHESFSYKPSRISLVNNGHTVQQSYDNGSSLSEGGGVTYSLAQFHFHSPSEHTLNGQSFPLEIHLVHLDSSGKPALVVGLLVKEGRENPALDAVFANLPKMRGQKSEPAGGVTVDAAALLPGDRAHFAYDGSLTTPPCSEGIRWRVMRQPIEMSAAQISAYRSLPHLGHTNRPVQPTRGRAVTLIAGP